MNGDDALTQFAAGTDPGANSGLVGFRDESAPQLPTETEGFQAPPQDGEIQDAVASIFANPSDLDRYHRAKAMGHTEQEALAVGDNGIGKWNDVTATYRFPMVALPADDPNAKRDALVRLTGPGGTTLARVADAMPENNKLKGLANIDLNPAAAMAVGHPGGVQKITWQPVADKGELPSLDHVKDNPGNAGLPRLDQSTAPFGRTRVSGGMGGASAGLFTDPNQAAEMSALAKEIRAMHVQSVDPNTGVKTMSDGFTTLYPGGVIVYRRGNQVYEYNGRSINKVGTVRAADTPKTDEQLQMEAEENAAKRGVYPGNYPGGRDDPNYKADMKDVLQASRAGVGVDPKIIAQSIINGDAPPTLRGLYGRSGAVLTELEKQGFNLAHATLDWEAQKSYLHTLNGPQQLRLRQATEFVKETTPLVRKLSQDVSSAVPRSRFPVFNAPALAAARQGLFGQDAQNKATRLSAQIKDMQSELAIMYSGGNSSTDAKLRQAQDMLSSNWSEGQLNTALDLIDTNAQLRLNSIKNTTVAPADQPNKYFPDIPLPKTAAVPELQTPPNKPDRVAPAEVIRRAQERLKIKPNDSKAQKVIDYARETGMLQ